MKHKIEIKNIISLSSNEPTCLLFEENEIRRFIHNGNKKITSLLYKNKNIRTFLINGLISTQDCDSITVTEE